MILLGRRHPGQLSLSRFADGDLPPGRQRRVGRHVDRCDSCREYVRFIRALGDAARDLPPAAVPDIADAVIRRRRAGERGHLVEVVDPPGRDRGRVMAAASRGKDRRRFGEAIAAGLALVAVTASYLLLAPSAAATRGELTLEAARAAGDVAADAAMPVNYSPASYLAGEDSLRLRVEVTRNDDGHGGDRRETELRAVTLRRDGDGEFRGTLPVEEGDLFATAVVEDFEGVELDTDFGRLWELYVQPDDGRPSFETLESHYRSLEAYNSVLAAEWAERLTQEYPEHPLGWALQVGHQSGSGVRSVADSVREIHRSRLNELVRTAGSDPRSDGLAWLSRYAGYLGETALRDSLLQELARLDPRHPEAVSRLVVAAVDELGFGTPALVDRLEQLWAPGARNPDVLVHLGVQAAAAAGRPEALASWLDRGLRHPDVATAELLDDIEPYDGFAGTRVGLLRMLLAELEAGGEAERPLRMSASEFATRRRAMILRREIELAGALAEAGDEAAAAALYREAADRAWRPEDVRPHVDFLLAAGDTTAALPGMGLLAADPLSGDSAYARYASILEAGSSGPGSLDPGSFVARSRDELRRRLLASVPLDRKLRHDTRVTLVESASEEEAIAGEFFADGPTVLLLWDVRLGERSRWLTGFKGFATREWARESGVQAAILVPPTDRDDLAKLRAGPLALVIDAEHELAAQLGARAVPSFVVVNRRLEVVAGASDAARAFRIAKLLTP